MNKIAIKEYKLLPAKGSLEATCYDLRASETVTIQPGEVKLVGTGVKTNLANKIYARSSLPYKKGLMLANSVGIIDKDFRGEIKAQLYNFTKEPVTIQKYDRIVQMELEGEIDKVYTGEEYENWAEFEKTDRGEGGFGSTGNK